MTAAATLSHKQWVTAQAQAAMQGITLHRTDPADGPVQFFACRFGLVRVLTPGELRGLLEPAEARP